VHCHHGQHRGPTAAALCGLALEAWTTEQAVAWLEQAGTAPIYRGLYTCVRAFVPPSAEELEGVGTELPEQAPVPALVELMVKVDQRWDRLRAAQKAGLKVPPDHPDIDPPHEARQLAELFRESQRLPEALAQGNPFRTAAAAAERDATALEAALRNVAEEPTPENRKVADAALRVIGMRCTNCHARFRDNR
jgi:hypothetical protein